MQRAVLVAVVLPVVQLAFASAATAELVVLTSGRTLSVRSFAIDGDSVHLRMRDGGEITCQRSLIDRIVPDEVPFDEPEPAAAEAGGAAEVLPASPYDDIILSAAQANGVDPVLVRALIHVESNYRPAARSRKGAMGLMQLMPATARQYNVRNPYDPAANIGAGVRHLSGLIERWGVELALAAYNAGEGAVQRFNGIPPYQETRTYVARVLSLAGIR